MIFYAKLAVFVLLFWVGWSASDEAAHARAQAAMGRPLNDEYARLHRDTPHWDPPVAVAVAPF